jgi:hypothetical protein
VNLKFLECCVDQEQSTELLMLGNKLSQIRCEVEEVVNFYQDSPIAILTLLRELESLHREIREDVFQKQLPDSRHELHALLRDIEANGGWPYIERMRIQGLLANLIPEREA